VEQDIHSSVYWIDRTLSDKGEWKVASFPL